MSPRPAARIPQAQSFDTFRRALPYDTDGLVRVEALHSAVDAPAALTPWQRQIAQIAAVGHTNKEIVARLYLSPRTVAAHLYQAFPKLGITSRAVLRDALGNQPSE